MEPSQSVPARQQLFYFFFEAFVDRPALRQERQSMCFMTRRQHLFTTFFSTKDSHALSI